MQLQNFSIKKYIETNARKLPIEKCLISDLYNEKGLTSCIIIKKQASGKFAFAVFLIDRLCLGIKSVIVNCNFSESEITEFIAKFEIQGKLEKVTPAYFNNLVFAALDYAEDLGFKPPKEFNLASMFLNPDLIDESIDSFEMGWEGKPFFIQGPYDDTKKIISILKARLGEGNFDYISGF